MQNIIFMLILFLGLLQADTLGTPTKSWIDVPMSSSVEVTEELENTSTIQTETFAVDSEKYRKMVLDFINPLWFFIRDYTVLFISFLTFLFGLFYIFFYRPLAKRVKQSDDEDIMISSMETPNLKERVNYPDYMGQ